MAICGNAGCTTAMIGAASEPTPVLDPSFGELQIKQINRGAGAPIARSAGVVAAKIGRRGLRQRRVDQAAASGQIVEHGLQFAPVFAVGG
jgi:hypothetical protein